MVYLGLSQDETLKNYRLLGHGKGFILLALSHLPSRISVFYFICSGLRHQTALRRSEIGAGGKYSISKRRKSCQFHRSFLFLISSSEGCDAGPEQRRILICIMSFTMDLIWDRGELLTSWMAYFKPSYFKGENKKCQPQSQLLLCGNLWSLLYQVGSQLTLGFIISFQGGSTTLSFYRFYLPNWIGLSTTSSMSHTAIEIQSKLSLFRQAGAHVSEAFPSGYF